MKRQSTTTDVALVAAFAALIAVAAILPAIKTGVGVPVTLQTFAVLLAGACLGPVRGFLAVCLYLLGGIAGLPIFSGGGSGIGHFTGITAGYLVGFAFAAALCGWIVQRNRTRATDFSLVFTAGLLSSAVFIHALGILGMMWRGDLSLSAAFSADVVFFPGDILKNVAMALVATSVHRAFPDLLARRSPATAPAAEPATAEV
ncbi:MAG: BioY family transporter [Nocardioides sp.]|nr:BioY family transporter [Nocardioides sp.]